MSIRTFRWLAASLLLTGLAGTAVAQQASPNWLDVAVVQVKPDQGPAFEDLIKEFMNARAAAGLPGSTVYQVQIGHPNEYHIVSLANSIAESQNEAPPMSEGEMAVWVSRIQATADNVRFFYAATMPDASMDGPANAQFLLLRTIRVVSGKQDEYIDWVMNQWLPAFRQTEGMGHTLSRGAFGDSPQNFYHAYGFADLSMLDQPDPLLPIVGERRLTQIFDAIDDIVESHEIIIARVRQDLMAD